MLENQIVLTRISRGWATVYIIITECWKNIVLDRKTGTHLLHWPVEEVESLRYNGQEFKEIELEPGSIIPLDIGTATRFYCNFKLLYNLDIVATFEVDQAALNATSETDDIYGCTTSLGAAQRGSLGPFGLAVLADGTLSELTPSGVWDTVPVLDDEELTMRLLVDHSIVEGFAQGGRTVITSRVYPTKAIYEQAKLFLFNNATGTSVKASLKIWQMASAQIHQYSF
ncbi:putative beta-fructofuranosidase, 2,1-fructan:2,1-fructan 1-fructosyltransferase [Helianthus annuus]|nr:putative beta-fructofuranosidase, 2,1-fructan:2,1-fructan 1-fructosyltransferase [Helianthus annuus]